MTKVYPTNILGHTFDGQVMEFEDYSTWKLGKKISEKSFCFGSDKRKGVFTELQAVYPCHQISPESNNKEGIGTADRSTYALPTDTCWSEPEYMAVELLTQNKCSSSPQLYSFNISVQESEQMPVPGGYFFALLMEKLPGVTLDPKVFFTEYSFEKREKIRAAFLRACSEVADHCVGICDSRLQNLIYDEENDKCYLIDYEDASGPWMQCAGNDYTPGCGSADELDISLWGLSEKKKERFCR
ncbi:hypothetical protein FQN57_004425 [Myotisia sp. PD_48]|nr:hypothetical protein FQN57_004425 [Myotisia sp. PD_48]